MDTPRLGRLIALVCAVALVGCSESSVTKGAPECSQLRACGSSAPAPSTEVPPEHRSTAQACGRTPAAAMVFSPYRLTGTPCTGDDPCTTDAGVPGKCLHGACSADECLTDDDCANGGVCVCSSPTGSSAIVNRNSCVPGNCRVDADCGVGGHCAPSAGTCGIAGFFCRTPADTCVDAAKDCGASCLQACHYFPEKNAFACLAPMCGGC